MSREVAAVAQGDLFVERIGGKEFLQIALVELRDDLDDLHVHAISRRGEGLAVAEQQGHITGAFAGRAQRVAIDRGVGVRNFRQRRNADVDALRRIHDVGTRLGGVFLEGLDPGAESLDGQVPFRFVGIGGNDEVFQRRGICRAQGVEIQIVLTGDFIDELPVEFQPADVAQQWIQIDPLLQVRRGQLEIGLTVLGRGLERAGQRGQADGGAVEQDGFGAGRIVQDDARGGGAAEGDRLLIEHGGAGLAADGGQAIFREREGFGHAERRRIGGPGGEIEDRRRSPSHRIAGVGPVGIFRPQVGQRLAHRGTHHIEPGRKVEAGLHVVVEIHAQRGSSSVHRPAVDPVVALAVLVGERRVKTWRSGHRAGGLVITGAGIDLHVPDETGGGIERQRQGAQRCRHDGIHLGAGGHRIGQGVERVLTQHLKDRHRGTLVIRIGVLDQHPRQRREGSSVDEIEVIPQGISGGANQQGVFLIRVVPELRRIRLAVNAARGDGGRQGAGTCAGSQHDARQRDLNGEIVDSEGFVIGSLVEIGTEADRQSGQCFSSRRTRGSGHEVDQEGLLGPAGVAVIINVGASHRSHRPRVADPAGKHGSLSGCRHLSHVEAFADELRAIDENLERFAVPSFQPMELEGNGGAILVVALQRISLRGDRDIAGPIVRVDAERSEETTSRRGGGARGIAPTGRGRFEILGGHLMGAAVGHRVSPDFRRSVEGIELR